MRRSILFVLLLLASSCGLSPEVANPMLLKTYDVPKGQAARIRESLRTVLWLSADDKSGHWVGRADSLPNNQLLVLAPKQVQAGVQELVDAATAHPYPDDKATQLRYWLVVGKKSPGAAAPALGVPEIQPAVEAIVREGGPQDLSVVQTARVASFTNHEGSVEAQKMKVRQTATSEGDTVWANIDIDFRGDLARPGRDSKISTRVRLSPGQTIVLGASGYGEGGERGDGAILYYLVRAVAPLGT